jgi:short/branched chain acyl-CoA dehydrogenase
MGIETPSSLNGAEMNFVSSLIVIEELAKVDPAISVIVDIQNTLVNTAIRKVGNDAQHKSYLPRLAQVLSLSLRRHNS